MIMMTNFIAENCSSYNQRELEFKVLNWGLPGGSVVKNMPANAGGMGLISDPGRSHVPQSN